MADPSLRRWLICRCAATGTRSDQPIPLGIGDIQSGNRVTHHSHKLYSYRKLVYCNTCGGRDCRLGMIKLGSQRQPPEGYGLASLEALKEGRLPPGLTRWPDEPIAARQDLNTSLSGIRRKGVPFSHKYIRFVRATVHIKPAEASDPLSASANTASTLAKQNSFIYNLRDLEELH